jgi:hypothetical protein
MAGDRYTGKPLLRLLECYVLWSIGALEPKDQVLLTQMEPKLRDTYQLDGTWHEVVAGVMDFPPNMPDLIRASWERNSGKARAVGEELQPEHFSEMFVDANLVPKA